MNPPSHSLHAYTHKTDADARTHHRLTHVHTYTQFAPSLSATSQDNRILPGLIGKMHYTIRAAQNVQALNSTLDGIYNVLSSVRSSTYILTLEIALHLILRHIMLYKIFVALNYYVTLG